MTKPEFVILEGSIVRLVPLVPERDSKGLYEVSNGQAIAWGNRYLGRFDPDATIWRYLFDGPMESVEQMVVATRRRVDSDRTLCFCVYDVENSRPIGMANFASNYPEHRRIELGGLWLSPISRRTGAAAEMVWLMLDHLFSKGYQRVEWKCDTRNDSSRRAAERFGFVFEGIQERHMIVKGQVRDTMWFRMLADEWELNGKKLRKRIQEGQ